MKKIVDYYGTQNPPEEKKGDIKYDGVQTFDKVSDVYYAGATHEEKQPPHLKVLSLDTCYNRCTKEYGNPCVRFLSWPGSMKWKLKKAPASRN